MPCAGWANKMGTGGRRRERPMVKQSKAAIRRALASHDAIQAESDTIRARHGLPPVPENSIVRSWREKVGEVDAKAAPRQADLSPAERVDGLAARRAKLARERERLDREVGELVAAHAMPVAAMAERLGLTRQRLYQLREAV